MGFLNGDMLIGGLDGFNPFSKAIYFFAHFIAIKGHGFHHFGRLLSVNHFVVYQVEDA
jgi:hypothetical protein